MTRRTDGEFTALMRHLGILAHSIEGAALCLRTFAQHGSAALGNHQHPDVTLDCISMARSLPSWDAGEYGPIREILAESIRRLQCAGADFFVCPDNTAHIALDEPGDDLALPGLHIAEVVAGQAQRDGRREVGILGTKYTMSHAMYPKALAAQGIASMIPDDAECKVVDDIIFGQLVEGVFSDEARHTYVRIIEHLQDRGCDAVALVCTEIPLLITEDVSPLPPLDSTRLLAAAAFDVSIETVALPTWRGGPRPGSTT